MRPILVLLVLGVSAFSVSLVHAETHGRILGGVEAAMAQYNYVVSLRTQAEGHFCSGFIYNQRWIVTAAHCVRNRTAAEITAHMGAISRTDQGIVQNINRIQVHPEYDPWQVINNIAMLQSAGQIVPTGLVGTIAINNAVVAGGIFGIVSGWGRTTRDGALANTLKGLRVETMTLEECRAQHSNLNRRFIYDSTLCTTVPLNEGLCLGDGGNPLVAGEGVARQVIGIASWNMPCGTGTPDVYVRLQSYTSWINTIGIQVT